MPALTVTTDHQVIIPKSLVLSLGLEPGEKIQAFEIEGRIELVPLIPIEKARGILKGIDTTVAREPDRF